MDDKKDFLIPVGWEVYSTIRVTANSLEEALEYAKEHIDDIPLGEGEYIDGTYMIDDADLELAQNFAHIGGVDIEVGQFD